VEYGVVEHAYAVSRPDDFAALVDSFGHTAIAARRYTVSSYLARTLGDLSRIGTVLYHPGVATGTLVLQQRHLMVVDTTRGQDSPGLRSSPSIRSSRTGSSTSPRRPDMAPPET
jgi:hypothetical protein